MIAPLFESGGREMTVNARSGISCVVLVAIIILANYFFPLQAAADAAGRIPAYSGWTLAAWLVTVVAMVLILAAIGKALQDRPAGVIIDNRNRISLSKLQMIGWTVLILSGLVTLAATMLARLYGAPATLTLDGTLIALMGISTTTLVAAPGLLSLKTAPVDTRPAAENAHWTDLVQGDEAANADAPDLSKIQQVLITLIVMGIYAFMLGNMLRFGPAPIGLPVLDEQLIWLIGVSHAGYLSYKAMPHSSGGGGDPEAPGAEAPAAKAMPARPRRPVG